MIVFVTALICGAAITFAGIPAAVNNANRIHIENGREPNAGVAFMPELIVIVGLWWGIGAALEYFFDLPVALVSLLVVSVILFMIQILHARKSKREYASVIAARTVGAGASAPQKQEATSPRSRTTSRKRVGAG
jgi:hypothetical protein